MKLEEYLQRGKKTAAEFAKMAGIPDQTIRNILKGYETTLSTGLKIQEFTHGLVSCEDLLPTKKRQQSAKKKETQCMGPEVAYSFYDNISKKSDQTSGGTNQGNE